MNPALLAAQNQALHCTLQSGSTGRLPGSRRSQKSGFLSATSIRREWSRAIQSSGRKCIFLHPPGRGRQWRQWGKYRCTGRNHHNGFSLVGPWAGGDRCIFRQGRTSCLIRGSADSCVCRSSPTRLFVPGPFPAQALNRQKPGSRICRSRAQSCCTVSADASSSLCGSPCPAHSVISVLFPGVSSTPMPLWPVRSGNSSAPR